MFGMWPSGGQQLTLAQTAQEGFPDFPDTSIRKGENSAPEQVLRGQGEDSRRTAPRAKAFSAQSPGWTEPSAGHLQEPTTNSGAGPEVGFKPLLHLWVME